MLPPSWKVAWGAALGATFSGNAPLSTTVASSIETADGWGLKFRIAVCLRWQRRHADARISWFLLRAGSMGLRKLLGEECKAGNNRAAHSTDQYAEAFCASNIAESMGKITMLKCKSLRFGHGKSGAKQKHCQENRGEAIYSLRSASAPSTSTASQTPPQHYLRVPRANLAEVRGAGWLTSSQWARAPSESAIRPAISAIPALPASGLDTDESGPNHRDRDGHRARLSALDTFDR